jgi:predicted HTH domain antitoxin
MGMHKVEVEYPDEVLAHGMSEEQIKRLAREAVYAKLYEQGVLSSSQAAALLGITRWEFLDLLGRYGVSYFDDTLDLDEELRRAEP